MTTTSQAEPTAVRRRTDAGHGNRSRRRRLRALVPWAFLIIPLLLVLEFKLIPAFDGLWMSFSDVKPLLGNEFVGLDNYTQILQDTRFHAAIGHTLVLAAAATIGGAVIGFAMALLLEGSTRRLMIARSVIFLPVVTAVAVIGEAWRLVYSPSDFGLLNQLLGVVGLSPQQFLADPSTALWWVAVVEIWVNAPYDMLIFLAGLVAVDQSFYEAGAVDGVSTLGRIRHIVIPGVRASLSVVLTLSVIRSLRIFTEVFVLTGGGPAGATDTWMTRVYSIGFSSNNLGLASAAAMLLLLVTIVATTLVRWYSAKKLSSS